MCVNEIFRLGKGYAFPRPEKCLVEGCGSFRIWGHGFVLRYLECFNTPLWFKRWRCPDCGCVYTVRPVDYWSRHHLPAKTIVSSLSYRITHGFWDKTPALTRQRQGHWLRALKKNIAMRLGVDKMGDLIKGFNELFPMQLVPVLRWSG